MTQEDYRTLCIRLLKAVDAGNAEAEELILCQIRTALNQEAE